MSCICVGYAADTIPPQSSDYCQSSNNAVDTTGATAGDVISLTFSTETDSTIISASCNGIAYDLPAVVTGQTDYTLTHNVVAGDVDGSMDMCSVVLQDSAGNTATLTQDTSDGCAMRIGELLISWQRFDRYALEV